MPALKTNTREHLVEAYITPLRSAMFIDDAFPRYEDLLASSEPSAPASAKYDYPGVRRLLELCRDRDLMCDVENRATRILSGDKLSHVLKSDLVVLDYHLLPTDPSDPTHALDILSKLATSPHDNLVVVYTNGDLQRALLETAVHFRGVDASVDYADDVAAELADWNPEIESPLLYATVSGDDATRKRVDSKLRAELDVRKIPRSSQTKAIRVRTETWLRDNYARRNAPESIVRPTLEMSTAESGMFWLSCENVFVTFVKKSPHADIFKSLEDALVEWSPSILRLMLARVRTRLEEGGFEYDRVVGSRELEVGILYHALAGEEPEEGLRIRGLFSRLFEGLHDQLVTTVSDFGHRLLRSELGDGEAGAVTTAEKQLSRLEDAHSLARSSLKLSLETVLLALNAFLCSTRFSGSHVTTGTVFQDIDAGEWWLCVSPACELVPRKPRETTWQYELHPCLPMFALRLKPASANKALAEADKGRDIFIQRDGEILVLHVVDANTKQPVPVMFMISSEGRTDARHFAAHAISVAVKDTEALPTFKLKGFLAVAQLRHEYADRLLQQTGHHTSRIGVDFVKLYKPSRN